MNESDFIYHMRLKIFEEADKRETSTLWKIILSRNFLR